MRALVQPGAKQELAVPSEFPPCCRMLAFKMESVNKAGHLMSLAALQQYDPYINKLLDVTGQVALYKFNSKANEWVRSCLCSAAGAGFLPQSRRQLTLITEDELAELPHGGVPFPYAFL